MRVTISGGVHGNELLGIYLVKKLQNESFSIKGLELDFLLANPKAIKECRRYIDYDLNRSFNTDTLTQDSHLYEFERAKVIKEHLKNCDFLIDLHTTTANMGITVVLSSREQRSENVAKILADEFDEVRILRWFGSSEGDFINVVAPASITIEVGAVCQGVLDSTLFFKTLKVVKRVLHILQTKEQIDGSKECYDIFETINFPRDADNEIVAMIHPDLMGRDYSVVHRGDPIFIGFDEREYFFERDEAYAVFINEAAYYEKGIAFCLSKKSAV